MIIKITRTQDTMLGGGDDSITLSELLSENGYFGKFYVDFIDDSNDSEEIINSYTIDTR